MIDLASRRATNTGKAWECKLSWNLRKRESVHGCSCAIPCIGVRLVARAHSL